MSIASSSNAYLDETEDPRDSTSSHVHLQTIEQRASSILLSLEANLDELNSRRMFRLIIHLCDRYLDDVAAVRAQFMLDQLRRAQSTTIGRETASDSQGLKAPSPVHVIDETEPEPRSTVSPSLISPDTEMTLNHARIQEIPATATGGGAFPLRSILRDRASTPPSPRSLSPSPEPFTPPTMNFIPAPWPSNNRVIPAANIPETPVIPFVPPSAPVVLPSPYIPWTYWSPAVCPARFATLRPTCPFYDLRRSTLLRDTTGSPLHASWIADDPWPIQVHPDLSYNYFNQLWDIMFPPESSTNHILKKLQFKDRAFFPTGIKSVRIVGDHPVLRFWMIASWGPIIIEAKDDLTVLDIMKGIYSYFNHDVSDQDKELLLKTPENAERVRFAKAQRAEMSFVPLAVMKGPLKRIDILGGHRRFQGLKPVFLRDGRWAVFLALLPDTLPQR